MQGAFSKLEAQTALLNAQLEKTGLALNGVNPAGYQNMQKMVRDSSKTFRAAAASTGMWETESIRATSATENYTKALQKQKLSFRDLWRNQKVAKAAFREQIALQNMVVRGMPGRSGGKQMLDLAVPTEVHKSMKNLSQEIGFIREQARSASTQMVNWGKNTQWAGRQLMVGFTMPVAAFGAAAGALAYSVDKEMTRVRKVYDTTANQNSTNVKEMQRVTAEFAQLNAAAFATAGNAAKQYGTSIKDTLSVQADLAATGQKGAELQGATTEVVKNAMLGEIDYQTTTTATIALQQQLHLSTSQLADTWAYMNSVENSTSLSMKDFATAIPIAMGPLKQMGGTVQTLGTLLTGMVSRGIAVGKAANGIKAAAQRLIRPSAQIREEFTALTGADIAEIGQRNKGNLLGMLQDIYKVTKDLSQYKRAKVLSGLFGSYQLATMGAMVDSMGDLANGVGQVSKAQDVGQQSAKQWRKVQEQEIGQWQRSASGQFKTAVANIQVQLAAIGEPFLLVASKVIKSVTWLLEKFNDMPKAAKYAVLLGAGFVALAGPVIMLTGLFANFMGMMLKFGVSITRVLGSMELLDRESAATRLATKLQEAGFVSAASAAQQQALAIERLTEATAIYQAQASKTIYNPTGMGVIGPQIPATGLPGAQKTPAATGAAAVIAGGQDKRFSAMMGGGLALSAAAMTTMMVSSNETVDNLAQMALTAGMLAPLIAGIPFKAMGASLLASSATVKAGLLPATASMGTKFGIAAFQFAKFAGPAGLLVGAIAGMKILHDHIDDNAEALQKVNQSGKVWSKMFNYTEIKPGQLVDEKTGQAVETLQSRVKELNKSAPEIGKAISASMNEAGDGFKSAAAEARALDIAIRQGMNVRQGGGTAEQAREAVRTSLMAGIGDANMVKTLMQKVDLQVDFNLNRSVMNQSLDQVKKQIDDAVSNRLDKTTSEKIWTGMFGDNDGISEASREAGKNAADNFVATFSSATRNRQIAMSRDIGANFQKMMDQAIAPLKNNKSAMNILKGYGVNKNSTAAQISVKTEMMPPDDYQRLKDAGVEMDGINERIGSIAKRQKEFVYDVARGMGYTEEQANKMNTMEDILKRYETGYRTVAQAQKFYNAQIDQGVYKGKFITEEMKLQLLNQARMSAGLEKTGNIMDGFGPVTKAWSNELGTTAAKVGGTNTQLTRTAALMKQITDNQIVDLAKNAMTDYQQQIADDTTAAMDKRADAAIAATAAQGEARMSRFENQQERASNAMEHRQEAESTAMEHRQEAASKAMENRQQAASDALDRRQQNASDALDARQERASNNLEARQEKRRKAIEKSYDSRIQRVNNEIKAEQKADEIRQRLFDAEMTRIDRLAESQNRNIDFNVALNTGNLDEAAKIRNDMEAKTTDYALSDARERGSVQSQARQDALGERADNLEKQKDAALDRISKVEKAETASLQRRQQRQKKFLENQQRLQTAALKKQQERESAFLKRRQEHEANSLKRRQEREKQDFQNSNERRKKALQKDIEQNNTAENRKWEIRKAALATSLKHFMGYIAMNDKDLKAHIKRWKKEHKGMTLVTENQFDASSKHIETYLVKHIKEARREVTNQNEWEASGKSIAAKMIHGAFGLNLSQFRRWMVTGVMPDTKAKPKKGGGSKKRTASAADIKKGSATFHTGGMIGRDPGGRDGVARTVRGLHPSEQMIRAQKGEYLVKRDAAAKNLGLLDAVNSGKTMGIDKHNKRLDKPVGGASDLGFSGVMMGVLAAAIKSSIKTATDSGAKAARAREAAAAMAGGPFAAGAGVAGFDHGQMQNAATIANVGRKLGASARDIQIALITAMVESGLRNLKYGDRDSVGLFQQRNAWGSFAERTNPAASARMFFLGGHQGQEGLFDKKNRNNMGMGEVAQAVQVSAFPGRYAEHIGQAKAVYAALRANAGAGAAASAGFVPGAGGKHKAVRGGRLSQGIHDSYTGYPAIDIGVPVGTPVYAVGDGKITQSYDIRGYEPRSNHGGLGYRSYGRVIYEKLDSGPEVLFAHLSKRNVSKGQRVKGGSIIGRSGNTGHSFGPHLHLGERGGSPYAFMKSGGFVMSDGLANLHEGESVMTEPLTRQLTENVNNFANEGNVNYNIHMHVHNAQVDTDDLANKVESRLRRIEGRKPQSRRG
jgi:murein DD-endopeptidase MepM/ murein hydrolase activator NlpD